MAGLGLALGVAAWALVVAVASLGVSAAITLWTLLVTRRVAAIEVERRRDELIERNSPRLVWWAEKQRDGYACIFVRNDGKAPAVSVNTRVRFRDTQGVETWELGDVKPGQPQLAFKYPVRGVNDRLPVTINFMRRDLDHGYSEATRNLFIGDAITITHFTKP